jgi:hypothetical protein
VVQLTVPAEQFETRWSPIAPTNPAVLEPVSNGSVTLPRGITATFLVARKRGVVDITSRRPDGLRWSATVVIT